MSGKTEPVTAVAFADTVLTSKKLGIHCAILAIGTESGHIEVWSIPLSSCNEMPINPTLLHSVPLDKSHFYTVNKIGWRPLINDDGSPEPVGDENENSTLNLTLASCGEDCGVRIFNIAIKQD
jgi:hypothetical protein